MQHKLLVDGIVQQTTVLIARLSTNGGARSPLGQVADQVFLELARELENQGVAKESVQGLGQECSLAAALVCQAAPATTPPVDASDVQTRDAGESTVIPMTSTESGRDGGAPRHDPDESSATPLTSTEGSRDAAPPGQDAGPIAFEFTRCATPTDLPASECATDLCFPEAFYWNATTDDRENGLRCHQDDCGRSDVYQAFAYSDDHVFLYMSYDPDVMDEYTTEAFAERFNYLHVTVYAPNSSGDKYETFHNVDTLWAGDPRITELRYVDGRIRGRLELGISTSAKRMIESSEETCFTGDILGLCYCAYEHEGIATTIEFDLPIEGAPVSP